MAVAYHTHSFDVPEATDEQAAAGLSREVFLVPANLPPLLAEKQGLNDALTSIAGLTTSADQMVYTTGADAYATTALTAYGRDIVGSIDASAVLTLLGAGTTGTALFQDETAADARTTLELGSLATLSTISNTNWSGADLAIENGGTGASSIEAARTNLGLGTAATADSTAFATSAQGLLADSAVQPGDGEAVPAGGTTGQVLAKASATDGDTFWTIAGQGDLISTNNGSDFADAAAARGNVAAIFADRATAEAATIKAAFQCILLQSYDRTVAVGAGRAHYKRVATEPTHDLKFRSTDRFLPDGTTDATNGGWWEIDEAELYVEMAGASPSASAVQNAAAMQACMDYKASLGGGVIRVGAGTFESNQITWKDRVAISGQWVTDTIWKAADGLNNDLFKTEGFDDLQALGNQWIVSEGVLSFIGLSNIQIDGNRGNNTFGSGLKLFAKALFFDKVVIRDCPDYGIYSEGGDKPGQQGWFDLPEGSFGPVWIRNCGLHGWLMRGPHDIHISALAINECGGDGLHMERSPGVYSASPDIGFAHIYANDGYGVYSNTSFRAVQLISESNYKEGVFLDGAGQVQIGVLQLYLNCRASGSFQFIDTASSFNNTISHSLIRSSSATLDIGGAQINGDFTTFEDAQIIGAENGGGFSGGIGLEVASTANYFKGSGVIRQFSGAGGTGLKTNGAQHGQYGFRLQDCATLWNNAAGGSYNIYNLTGFALAGEVAFTGSPPAATEIETWNVHFSQDGAIKSSRYRSKSLSFDANAAAGTTFERTFNHTLLTAPLIDDVRANVHITDSSGGTSFGGAGIFVTVQSVSATQIVTKVTIDRPAVAGSLGYVTVEVGL